MFEQKFFRIAARLAAVVLALAHARDRTRWPRGRRQVGGKHVTEQPDSGDAGIERVPPEPLNRLSRLFVTIMSLMIV